MTAPPPIIESDGRPVDAPLTHNVAQCSIRALAARARRVRDADSGRVESRDAPDADDDDDDDDGPPAAKTRKRQ